jgi:hypothetical protein
MYDGVVAAKLAIVILSFVAFGILCELLVLILRYIGNKDSSEGKKERREERE